MRIPSGTTNRYIYFVAVDPTDKTTRETGLSSFTVYYEINNGTATAMTTPTVTECDATNMPGVYTLLIDESGMTTLTAGHDTAELALHITQASMEPVTRVIEIYRPETTEGNTLGVASTGDISGNIDGEVGTIGTTGLNAAADAVWDEARSGHTTQGTFGEGHNALVSGTVSTGTTAADQTSFASSDITEATADHYIGRVIVFITGALAGQATTITDYSLVSSEGFFTVESMTEAPANNDRFVIF